MAWLLYIAPFAGIAFIGWLFVSQIVPQIQRAVGS
jgi:hypothetical protein